jgi:hypothetical protein
MSLMASLSSAGRDFTLGGRRYHLTLRQNLSGREKLPGA